MRADGNFLTVGYTRSRVPPWGLAGGHDGHAELCRGHPRLRQPTHSLRLRDRRSLNAGDVMRIVTGNGGGYGDPSERERQAVLDDIDSGYLTPGRAAEVYGVSAEGIG